MKRAFAIILFVIGFVLMLPGLGFVTLGNIVGGDAE